MRIAFWVTLVVCAYFFGRSRSLTQVPGSLTESANSEVVFEKSTATIAQKETKRQPSSIDSSNSEAKVVAKAEPFHNLYNDFLDYQSSWSRHLVAQVEANDLPQEQRNVQFAEQAAKSIAWRTSAEILTSKGTVHLDAYLLLLEDPHIQDLKCGHVKAILSDETKIIGLFQRDGICNWSETQTTSGFTIPIWAYKQKDVASYLSVFFLPVFKPQPMTYFDGDEVKRQTPEIVWQPSSAQANNVEFYEKGEAFFRRVNRQLNEEDDGSTGN
jgi:hypothetical protein